MRVRILPRDVAAEVITGSIAPLGWAVGAATLVLAMPVIVETLSRAGRLQVAWIPITLLWLMLICLAIVVARARPWAVVAYLVVGCAATVGYELVMLQALPGSLDTQIYLINRPAVALALVGLVARTPLVGMGWSLLGFAVSTASTVVVSVLADVPFRPGYGPLVALIVSIVAYITLWGIQVVQRRKVPNIEELEAENARIARGEDLSRRTTAMVHDTLLSDLTVVVNTSHRLDPRGQQRLVDDLATLQGADWLRASRQVTVVDEQDSWLRNEISRLITGFQWQGLSVRVTASGDGVVGPEPTAAEAIIGALSAALDNVAKHSGASAVDIELVYGATDMSVMVTDEGVGFDPDAVSRDRLGIRSSIQTRIRDVGGTVQLWSNPESGTSIVITVPVTVPVPLPQTDAEPADSRQRTS